ncbi:hypothetical protein ANO14919_087770 [Xylariales sp. No.14919]|nr:hypothetical protein ANO14919_087770 [Xylariales sp. No.14919]
MLPPYQVDKDPFHRDHPVRRYADVTWEGIPPTPKIADSIELQDEPAILSKLNGLTQHSSEEDIALYIQKCHSLNLIVDVNRMARLAICRNAVAVVRFLIDDGKADLDCRDTYGKTAIFYALWDYPDEQMFQYFASKIPRGSKRLNHRDCYARTALHYAIALERLRASDFLLALEPDAEIIDEVTGRLAGAWYLQSLLRARKLISMMPKFDIQSLLVRPQHERVRLHPITKLQDDYPLVSLPPDGRGYTRFWVHIPWANGILFFFALRRYGRDLGYHIRSTDWLPSLFRQPAKIPANPNLPYTDPTYESGYGSTSEITGERLRALIIFPCLILRSRAAYRRERNRINGMRAEITDTRAKNMLQPELTLDETYFPSLPTDVLDKRNTMQVVSRQCTESLNGKPTNEDTQPMLMVPQLWLWRCDRYILSAFSANDGIYTAAYNINIRKQMSKFVSKPIPSPGIHTGLLIAQQISEFGNPQTNGIFGNPQAHAKFPSPLDIFEASAAQVLTEVDVYMDLNTPSRPDMNKEHDFMFRIADIREELAMINEVLSQQLEVLQKFIEDFELYNPDSHSFLDREFVLKGGKQNRVAIAEYKVDTEAMEQWETVKRSRGIIEKYQKRVRKIDGDAERVEKRIQDQLNLKRTHASIEDARASLTLGTHGLILSTAVIGFTVVTIIFAPLAFVTALFALPIDTLLSNQFPFKRAENSEAEDSAQTTDAYTTSYVARWFIVAEFVSLGVTILLVILGVWLLRASKSFSALQENHMRNKLNRGDTNGSQVGKAAISASGANVGVPTSGQERTGIRKRVGEFLPRHKEQITPSYV